MRISVRPSNSCGVSSAFGTYSTSPVKPHRRLHKLRIIQNPYAVCGNSRPDIIRTGLIPHTKNITNTISGRTAANVHLSFFSNISPPLPLFITNRYILSFFSLPKELSLPFTVLLFL